MLIFKEFDVFKRHIVKLIENNDINIITIDGVDGSGKTTLASDISKQSSLKHIEIDDIYLVKNQGKYVDAIQYRRLKYDISWSMNNNQKLIIDGICILEILDKINIYPDLKIYVKKITDYNIWHDGIKFDYSKNVEVVLKQEDESLKEFIKIEAELEGKKPEIDKIKESIFHEIMRYHFKYQPNLKSDVIYEW